MAIDLASACAADLPAEVLYGAKTETNSAREFSAIFCFDHSVCL
eukprot:COSAG01_NODE_282_length_19505_cov_101.588117_8_plen_44_part_00